MTTIPPTESDDELSDSIFSGELPRQPLTEFVFTTATVTIEPHQPELNLGWFRDDDDES